MPEMNIEARPCTEGGVSCDWLRQVRVAPRQGGERFVRQAGRPPRSLKLQYQAAGVPAWARHGPLLWAAGQLLFVPGLGLDGRALAQAGMPQMALHWWPDAALSGPPQPAG